MGFVLVLSACHGMGRGDVVKFIHLMFCWQNPFEEWCEASAALKRPWNCSNLHLEQEQAKLGFSRNEKNENSCNNIIPNSLRSSDEHLRTLPQAAEVRDWITVDYILLYLLLTEIYTHRRRRKKQQEKSFQSGDCNFCFTRKVVSWHTKHFCHGNHYSNWRNIIFISHCPIGSLASFLISLLKTL